MLKPTPQDDIDRLRKALKDIIQITQTTKAPFSTLNHIKNLAEEVLWRTQPSKTGPDETE
jgi:hypothetical protein